MLKRLADRLSSAVSSVAGPQTPSPTDSLVGMGFSEADARRALGNCNGNVDQAAEWLLANANSLHATTSISTQSDDADLQRAINASLQEAVPVQQPRQPQTAAARRAGQAALARFEQQSNKTISKKSKNTAKQIQAQSTTTKGIPIPQASKAAPLASHPGVRVPKELKHHDTEDVILRCARRVAPHSMAVDTLLRSLRQLQQDTSNMKFRTIDTSSAGFQRSLNVPGVVDFFKAMGYQTSFSNQKVLELSYVDPATLYLGISALEQTQLTSEEYKQNKALREFDAIMKTVLTSSVDSAETSKRSQFLGQLPSEPTMGGGQITVELGTQNKVSRKFDGDDCLEDVLNWLGSCGSELHTKLVSGEWHLVNRNHRAGVAYNLSELRGKTLQYIGCWPSGLLAVVATPPVTDGELPGSSRGLGAAPMDALTTL